MQVSKKPKIFWNNFVMLLESTLNFEHFEKKNDPQSLSIFEILDCKRRGYLNA